MCSPVSRFAQGNGGLNMERVDLLGAQFQVPGAMGMILSGMLLRNAGSGLAIAGLRASWSKQIRGAALAIIFLRSGLEIDLDVRAWHSSHNSGPGVDVLVPG